MNPSAHQTEKRVLRGLNFINSRYSYAHCTKNLAKENKYLILPVSYQWKVNGCKWITINSRNLQLLAWHILDNPKKRKSTFRGINIRAPDSLDLILNSNFPCNGYELCWFWAWNIYGISRESWPIYSNYILSTINLTSTSLQDPCIT